MSAIRLSSMVILLCCILSTSMLVAQDFVTSVDVKSEQASFKLEKPNTLLVEIAGPNEYQFRQEIEETDELMISNLKKDGTKFQDGLYSLQVTPIIKLPADQLKILQDLREKRDAYAIQEFRQKYNLPEEVHAYTYSFSIKNGKFVYPKLNEKAVAFDRNLQEMGIEHPDLYASIHPVEMSSGLNLPNDNSALFAQVFTTDVIVQGSICVGFDCSGSQSFGFDTQILKENNLRLFFDDTSNSASFPNNDWRLVANETSNGGKNFFGIQDATANRYPFQVEGGAPNNALYVDDGGRIGIGTSTPVVEIHNKDGDTPTMRLEQDGSSGFTAQIWDVAGNETNFFIRDATNGSALPFKIRPGADDNALVIDNDNNIGIGILNATQKLHVKTGNVYVEDGNIGIKKVPTVPLDVMGNTKFTGTHIQTGDASFIMTTGVSFINSGFFNTMKVDGTNNRVGIALGIGGNPGHALEVGSDDAAKPSGGMWVTASDRRLKENIESFSDGLDVVLKMKPVSYNYNGKLGYPTDKQYVGIIAQDMKEIAPYTVFDLPKSDEENNDYLGYDGTPLTYILVNAIKDQQKIIDQQNEQIAQLEDKVSEIAELKAMLTELSSQVASLTKENATEVKAQNAERE